MITSFYLLKKYIASDLFRYMTSSSPKAFMRAWFIPGFRYCFFMRCCQYFTYSKLHMLWLPIYFIFRLILRHYQFKYGISIHHTCKVGPGLYIGHFGNIIINPNAIIGKNCNLSPGVLLGLNFNKDNRQFEYPVVGDRVSIGNDAKLIGGVSVGNGALIGVSTVVTKSLPANAVAVGIPAKIINYEGASQFVGSFHPWTLTFDEA